MYTVNKTVPQLGLALKCCETGKAPSDSCSCPVCTRLTKNKPKFGKLKILSPNVINKEFKEKQVVGLKSSLTEVSSMTSKPSAEKKSIGKSEKMLNVSKIGTHFLAEDVHLDSMAASSVLHNSLCSVQIIPSVNPDGVKIGTGDKCVQFFYGNLNDSPAFPPVYVHTDEEVQAVAALVAQRANYFNLKYFYLSSHELMTTQMFLCVDTLEKDVLKHIKHCFTKLGMKEFKKNAMNMPTAKLSSLEKKKNYTKNRKRRRPITADKIYWGEKPSDGETAVMVKRIANKPEIGEDLAGSNLKTYQRQKDVKSTWVPPNNHHINQMFIKEENAVFIKEEKFDNIMENNNTHDYCVKEGFDNQSYFKTDSNISKSDQHYTQVEIAKVDFMEVEDIKIESCDSVLEQDPLNTTLATVCESGDSIIQSFSQHKINSKTAFSNDNVSQEIDSYESQVQNQKKQFGFPGIRYSQSSRNSLDLKRNKKYPGLTNKYLGFGQVSKVKSVNQDTKKVKGTSKQIKPLSQNHKGIAEIPKSNKKRLDFHEDVFFKGFGFKQKNEELGKLNENLGFSSQFSQSRKLDDVYQSNCLTANENTKQLMLTAKKLEFNSFISSSKPSSLSGSAKKQQVKPSMVTSALTASQLPLPPPVFPPSNEDQQRTFKYKYTYTKFKPSDKGKKTNALKKVANQSHNQNDKNFTESDLDQNESDSLLDGVIMAISGFENPLRSEIRCKAMSMGAQYRSDWTKDCTHLVCAFPHTPKYQQANGEGKIVVKEWIEDCYEMRKKLDWKNYILLEEESEDQDDDEDNEAIEDIDIKEEPLT